MNFLLFSILFSTFLVSNAQNAQNEHEPGSVYSPNYTYKLTLHGDPKNMYKDYEGTYVQVKNSTTNKSVLLRGREVWKKVQFPEGNKCKIIYIQGLPLP